MIHSTHITFKIALFFSAFFICTESFISQDIIDLSPGAEKLSYIKETGEHRLIGDIHLSYQNVIFYCDSASYFEGKSILKAYGNVHLNKSNTLNLYCDSLVYLGNKQHATLWGHVKVMDKSYKITTDTLFFDTKNELGIYHHWGKISHTLTSEKITSKNGYFYPKTNQFTVSGNVVYTSEKTKMNTDSLHYNPIKKRVYFFGKTNVKQTDGISLKGNKGWYNTETEESLLLQQASIKDKQQELYGDSLYSNPQKNSVIAQNNVIYKDSSKHLFLTGNKLTMNKKKRSSFLTGNPLIHYGLKKDTLIVSADTLFLFTDSLDGINEIKGYKNSCFFSKQTQGICDSIHYSKKTNRLDLLHNPILWSNKIEIKGGIISLLIKDSSIQKATISKNATAISKVDTFYFNQLGGKIMHAYFDSTNQVKRIEVSENAKTIYYPEEKTETDTLTTITRKGMNRIYASEIKVDVSKGKFSKVTYTKQIDGLFYPIAKINTEEQFIQGFHWFPTLRPKNKTDLLLRRTKKKDSTL